MIVTVSTYIHVRPVTVSLLILSLLSVIAVTTMKYWTPELRSLKTMFVLVVFTDCVDDISEK